MGFKVFRNRVLRTIFGREEEGKQEAGGNYIMRTKSVTVHLQLSVWSVTLWTSKKTTSAKSLT
jgi:hypothetical protein